MLNTYANRQWPALEGPRTTESSVPKGRAILLPFNGSNAHATLILVVAVKRSWNPKGLRDIQRVMNTEESLPGSGKLEWRVANPEIGNDGDYHYLRFSVIIGFTDIEGASLDIWEIPGFRVQKGHVNVPLRPGRGKYYPMINVLEDRFIPHLTALITTLWASNFPQVKFPKSDAN